MRERKMRKLSRLQYASLIGLAGLAGLLLVKKSEAIQANLFVYSAVVNCSGEPWYDVRCAGAVGDGVTDDTAALNAAAVAAFGNNWPLYLPHATYKLTNHVDFVLQSDSARVVSDRAILDSSTYAGGSGAPLGLFCHSHASAANCNNFHLDGLLTILSASSSNFAFQWGFGDLVDSFDRAKIDRISVTNTGTSGACFVGNVTRSLIGFDCTSTNVGGPGLQMAQTRANTFLSLNASSPGVALVLTNSTNYLNTFVSPNLAGGGTCINIASASSDNVFIAPDLNPTNCGTPVSTSAGIGNTIISPNYTTSLGSALAGISVVNDTPGNAFASVPAGTGLPQIRVGGALTQLSVSSVTLAPVVAPAAPSASGAWTLYDDTADQKVKIKKSTGTVRTLAQ